MNGKEQIQKAYESILDNDFEQAIRSFEEAIELEPDNAEYHYKLSITYARSGRLTQALKHAKTACDLAPNQDAYRYHYLHLTALAMVQQAEKLAEAGGRSRLRLAERLLKEAAAKDPLCLEAHLLLSAVYAELGKDELAVRSVQEVLKLNPHHEAALQHIERYKVRFAPFLGRQFFDHP